MLRALIMEVECVRVNGARSEWFEINMRIHQGYVISPCLFNVFMDRALSEMREVFAEAWWNNVEVITHFMQAVLFCLLNQRRSTGQKGRSL